MDTFLHTLTYTVSATPEFRKRQHQGTVGKKVWKGCFTSSCTGQVHTISSLTSSLRLHRLRIVVSISNLHCSIISISGAKMKKPEDLEPKDLTEEEELSEAETDQVSGGVITGDPTFTTLEPSTPSIRGCKCTKGQGGTADWSVAG